MLLRDFVRKYKIDVVKFSLECGSRPTTMYKYISGDRKPKQQMAENIERESDGLVTVREQRGCDDRDRKTKNINDLPTTCR